MEIGIIGLAKSGKTTVFNALTKGKADVGTYAAGPNIGIAKVPDPRLDVLAKMYQPKKKTAAEVKYTDIAAPTKGELRGEMLNHISQTECLLHVVRAFKNENVPHIDGSVDSDRDIKAMDLELTISDLSIIEKRLRKIEDMLKSARVQEREAFHHEQALLGRIQSSLESETPLREIELTESELKSLSGYQFLSAKPMLIVFNIGEDMLPQAEALEQEWRAKYKRPSVDVAAVCGELEMELAQLDDDEAEVFRTDMGITEAALNRIVKLSYELLGMISFLTTGSDEVKAWTVRRDTTAVQAAGKIHTDIERGFIKAEVISFDDLVKCGSIAEGRKHGLLHTEGKTHIVKDGDVINFLFNV
ncbi:MAG: redox-regulated ATPase YchF [Chloroflexota bacterium]|nr:redox-regulated ATPase YchF [Chloroflexota bacterium]